MRRSLHARNGRLSLKEAAGTTLLEVLMVSLLLAMVVGGLMPLLTVGQLTWEHAQPRSDMVQNARIALDHMIRRLRAAQTFTTISATDIAFTYFFGDGSSIRTAQYQLIDDADDDLDYREGVGAFQPLAGPFRSMSVQCFDASGISITCAVAANVRSVQVSLVVMDPQGKIPDLTVTSRAFRQVP
jgi:hypothetical protein